MTRSESHGGKRAHIRVLLTTGTSSPESPYHRHEQNALPPARAESLTTGTSSPESPYHRHELGSLTTGTS